MPSHFWTRADWNIWVYENSGKGNEIIFEYLKDAGSVISKLCPGHWQRLVPYIKGVMNDTVYGDSNIIVRLSIFSILKYVNSWIFQNVSVKTLKIFFLQTGPSQNFQKGEAMSEHVVITLPGESFEECF